MSNPPAGGSGLTILGKLFSGLLVVGLVVLGAWIVMKKSGTAPVAAGGGACGRWRPQYAPTNWQANATPTGGQGDDAAPFTGADILKPTKTSVPRLDPPAAYVPNGNVVDIELSQYAGYAGLIVANGGLAPNDDSVFAKKYGFKVQHKTQRRRELERVEFRKNGRLGDHRGRAGGLWQAISSGGARADWIFARGGRSGGAVGHQTRQ